MKKFAWILALATLLTSLSACTPKGNEESPTDTQGLSIFIPTETPAESDTEPPIEVYAGPYPSNRGYRIEHILQDGDTGYFEGKMLEELHEEFVPYGEKNIGFARSAYISIGAFFQGTFTGETAYYDKQTGAVSSYCPNPSCDKRRCVWHQFIDFQYASKDHLYFIAFAPGTMNDCLWRCDHNRQNVKKLFQLQSFGTEEIFFVDGDKIYMNHFISQTAEDVVTAYGVYDCSTRKFTRIQAADGYTIREVTADGTVWCYKKTDKGLEIFCADPAFTKIESYAPANAYTLQSHAYRLAEITDTHVIISKLNDRGISYVPFAIINRATEKAIEMAALREDRWNITYSGQYMYYTKLLTDEEIEASPLKDYYLHKNSDPNGGRPDLVYTCPNRDAGRIYRMNMETLEEEFVLQITYNDIPVWIDDIVVDGNVLYLSYATYLGFYNYYDQNHELQSTSNPDIRRVAVADLSNGSVQYVDYTGR